MKPLLPSPRAFALAALLTWSFAAYGRHIEGQSAGQPTQASTTAPQILKIDPPNWWATMPRPMLLVRGLNLSAAQVHLSDPNLKIESTQISENGIKATPFTPKPAPPISSEPSTRFKTLLTIRRSNPSLQDGEEEILHSDSNTLVYVRYLRTLSRATQRVLVAINKGSQTEDILIDTSGTTLEGAGFAKMLAGDLNGVGMSGSSCSLHLMPESAVIASIE